MSDTLSSYPLSEDTSRALLIARLKALICVVVWGTSFVTTKIIVDQIDPAALVPVRSLGGSVLLFVLLKRRGQWTGVVRDGRLLGQLAILGFVGVALHLTIQAIGLSLTTASNTGWILSMSPVFITLLAWKFLGERLGRPQVIGFLVALGGALLIIIARTGSLDVFGLPSTGGDAIVFCSTITWAVFSVLSKQVIGRHNPAMLMLHIMVMGFLMTIPLFVAREGWQAFGHLNLQGWLALAFTVVFVAGVGYLFWYDALSVLSASQVSVFLYIEPLVTVVLSALLLDEPLRPLSLLGGAAILFGVWLVSFRKVPAS